MRTTVDSVGGGVRFSVAVDANEMSTWSTERITSFFEGIAAVERALGTPSLLVPVLAAVRVSDDVGTFLDQTTEIGSDFLVASAALYPAYQRWRSSHPGPDALTRREFGLALSRRGFTRRKVGLQRHWHWLGLRLMTP